MLEKGLIKKFKAAILNHALFMVVGLLGVNVLRNAVAAPKLNPVLILHLNTAATTAQKRMAA